MIRAGTKPNLTKRRANEKYVLIYIFFYPFTIKLYTSFAKAKKDRNSPLKITSITFNFRKSFEG